jgi:hypothetical protein
MTPPFPSLDVISRLTSSLDDDDLPTLRLREDDDLPSLLQLRQFLETVNDIPPPLKARLANDVSEFLDTEYLVPQPSEASEARSFSSKESIGNGKKRRRSTDDSDASDELSPKKHRYQQFFCPAPTPFVSEPDLEIFENAPRKTAVLTQEDYDANPEETLERLHSVLDKRDKFEWSLSFYPVGDGVRMQGGGKSTQGKGKSSDSQTNQAREKAKSRVKGHWGCVSKSSP